MILKRNTRKAMFHFGLFVTMIGVMFSLGGYLLNDPIWFGLIILISGITCMIIPIIFVLVTPLEKFEKERNGEDWRNE